MLINAVSRAFGNAEKLLPRSHQLMLFWAGLRGAVAFALSSALVGASAPAMRTTVLAVVVLTVLIFGGTSNRMLQLLNIRTNVIEPDDSGSEDEDQEVEPARYRRLRLQSQDRFTSNDDLLVDVMDDVEYGNGTGQHGRNTNTDVSIGGLLSGPLGDPVPEPVQPHWFMSFDERYLKPLFSKRHIQARNQTLAEYWKERKRKMDRANRDMLAGIRSMSFGQASSGTDDYGDSSDALTLDPVKSSRPNRRAEANSSSSSSSAKVIGSGRIFGRATGQES